MNPPFPANWRYILAALAGWLLFLACVFGVEAGRAYGWPWAVVLVLAILPALIVVAQFLAAWRAVAAEDEFVRAIVTKQMLFATGAVIALVVGWSLTGDLLGLPRLPGWLIYPLFWGLFGVVSPFVKESRP
jgi:hypothetical protein